MPQKPQGPDYGAWMKSYGAVLRRYFRRRIPEDEVDDLVQDVFVRIQTAQSDEPVENVESYLFTTARHVLANLYRDQATRAALLRGELPEGAEVIDLLTPERIAIGFEEYERVVNAICNLPPRTRQAFELYRIENLTYQEIAKKMDITKNSVRDLMRRALDRIVTELEAGR